MTNTVEGGMYPGGPPNMWSIRPPVNSLSQSNDSFPQILRSYNRGKGAWYDNIAYGIFTDNFSYGVFDNTSLHVNITNGTDWAKLNFTWNVEPTTFRNAMFLDRKQLETETKNEYKIYDSNPLLVKFWDMEHIRGSDNYTVCLFNNINYSGSPTEDLKLYYCNGSYRTVPEQLPSNGSSDGTVDMSQNLLLLHFNNNSAYGENYTHVYDFSGNGNNGTVNGMPVWSSSAGKFDGAYTFDGINDYIETCNISHINGSNPMTIEFWFKTTFNSESQPIIDAGEVMIPHKSLEFWLTAQGQVGSEKRPPINTQGLYWGFWHNDIYIPSINYSDGNWHHVLVTLYDNTVVEISYDDTRPDGYIWNGDAGTWTDSPQPFTLSHPPEIETVPFWIGHSRFQFWGIGNTYFNGTIDEVAVYNRSLSTNEITEHYTQGVIKPVVSPYCVYLGPLSTTDLDDIDYTSRNSSYSKFCFGVNNSKIGGINTTNTFYIAYESETTTGNYTVRYANGSSGTNVSFNDSKVAWSSTNNATNWIQAKFTPDLWLASINSGDIFQLGVYVENSTGANYTNFMLYNDPIGDVNYPISDPGIKWYQSASGGTDSTRDGTHSGDMTIRVGMAKDPDGPGTVEHNLTLRYTNGSWCYTINESFNSSDDSDVDVVFDMEKVLNGVYKMNVIAVADDNSSDVTSFLTTTNFTIDNPTYVNTTGWWRCGGAFNTSSIPITSAVENATSGERICVLNGNYYNESVNVNMPHLTLYTMNPHGVNVSGDTNHVFNVTAGYVNITGFNVTGATGVDTAGFYLYNADNCKIWNNTVSGNTWDIRIENSSSTFENNRLNNTTVSFTYSGNLSLKGVGMPAGNPHRWNDIGKFINATNQSVGAWLFLNISYSDSDVIGLNESNLTIWKYNGTAWTEVGGVQVDSEYNIIGVNIKSFGVFSPGTIAPDIISWNNNKTKNDSTNVTLNGFETVCFNVTANQSIDTWHWYENGTDKLRDFDNFTTSWTVNGIYNVSVNATNSNGITNTITWKITVNDEITPPLSIIDLGDSTIGQTYINWTWTDPSDADFADVMIYLNGTFITNVSKDVEHYNATGLTPDTNYIISTHTVDTSGNINNAWVNDSATTEYDSTPPLSIIDLGVSTIGQTYINWTWNDPSDADFADVMVYLNGTFITNVSKDVEHYNATGLTPDTNYIISTHTVDTSGNINNAWVNDSATTEYDSTPPLSITGLVESAISQTYINWRWTDPSDADFAYVMIYLNGTFITNVSKDVEHYSATGLTPDTNYTISTHTVDTSGNINNTWVNDSKTSEYDYTPPLSIIGLGDSTIGQTYINWTWTDPSDADFAYVMIYLNGTFITNVSKDVEHYNATGLTPDTNYTISTHTADTSGNINNAWVNHTAWTSSPLHHIYLISTSLTLNIGESTNLTAVGYDHYDYQMSNLTFTWNSNPQGIGSFNPINDSTVNFTAINAGRTEVYAVNGNISSNETYKVWITVNAATGSGNVVNLTGNATSGNSTVIVNLTNTSVNGTVNITEIGDPLNDTTVNGSRNCLDEIVEIVKGANITVTYEIDYALENDTNRTSYLYIRVNYSDLQLGNIDEDTLFIYLFHNDSCWEKMGKIENPDLCIDNGRNTDDDYVWANVTQDGVFMLGGTPLTPPPSPSSTKSKYRGHGTGLFFTVQTDTPTPTPTPTAIVLSMTPEPTEPMGFGVQVEEKKKIYPWLLLLILMLAIHISAINIIEKYAQKTDTS
jgi:hypothetical protein